LTKTLVNESTEYVVPFSTRPEKPGLLKMRTLQKLYLPFRNLVFDQGARSESTKDFGFIV